MIDINTINQDVVDNLNGIRHVNVFGKTLSVDGVRLEKNVHVCFLNTVENGAYQPVVVLYRSSALSGDESAKMLEAIQPTTPTRFGKDPEIRRHTDGMLIVSERANGSTIQMFMIDLPDCASADAADYDKSTGWFKRAAENHYAYAIYFTAALFISGFNGVTFNQCSFYGGVFGAPSAPVSFKGCVFDKTRVSLSPLSTILFDDNSVLVSSTASIGCMMIYGYYKNADLIRRSRPVVEFSSKMVNSDFGIGTTVGLQSRKAPSLTGNQNLISNDLTLDFHPEVKGVNTIDLSHPAAGLLAGRDSFIVYPQIKRLHPRGELSNIIWSGVETIIVDGEMILIYISSAKIAISSKSFTGDLDQLTQSATKNRGKAKKIRQVIRDTYGV